MVGRNGWLCIQKMDQVWEEKVSSALYLESKGVVTVAVAFFSS